MCPSGQGFCPTPMGPLCMDVKGRSQQLRRVRLRLPATAVGCFSGHCM
jgi:hypothetical protein